jgi:hypothetical protein
MDLAILSNSSIPKFVAHSSPMVVKPGAFRMCVGVRDCSLVTSLVGRALLHRRHRHTSGEKLQPPPPWNR